MVEYPDFLFQGQSSVLENHYIFFLNSSSLWLKHNELLQQKNGPKKFVLSGVSQIKQMCLEETYSPSSIQTNCRHFPSSVKWISWGKSTVEESSKV